MILKRCHHHGFTVSNIERSLAFYRDVLGLELVRISERRDLPSYDQILGYKDVALTVALLRHPADEFLLELFTYHNPQGQSRPLDNSFVGAAHVAFEVEDIDVLYARLTEAGYRAISPPADVERDGAIVARAMYALDPDGISVELFQEFGDLVSS
jgi:lactoylglutathione lyase